MSKSLRSSLPNISYGMFNGYNELPQEVLNVFAKDDIIKGYCEVNSDATGGRAIASNRVVKYQMELMNSALNGGIHLDKEFHLRSWTMTVQENSNKSDYAKSKRYGLMHLDSAVDEESDKAKSGCITEDVASYNVFDAVKSGYEEFEDSLSLQYAVESIKAISEDFIVEEGVDLVVLLKNACDGVPDAFTKLKSICERFTNIAEQIKTILQSGVSIEQCFA